MMDFLIILIFLAVTVFVFITVSKSNKIKLHNEKLQNDLNFNINKLNEQLSEKSKIIDSIQLDRNSLKSKNDKMSIEIANVKNRVQQLNELIVKKDKLYELIISKTDENIKYFSSLISDHLLLQYSISAEVLENKSHPAYVEAKRIRDLKEKTKVIVERHKIIEYKYEYLINLFPELENYIDDFETIKLLSDYKGIDDLKENEDTTSNYLTKDEYNNLPINIRNQLALDRYISGQKTKWQIGRDYELFIGFEYHQNGWDVEYYGIEKQLEDMGRDLVAISKDEIHVIQCKFWSSNKEIHEKHIAQLYGTTIQFKLSGNQSRKTIVPVFVTNINLSPTAQIFADYLDVKVISGKKIGEFPRIKCNINRDEYGYETKIYHLPMDQQYDKTKIGKKGEFFAFTVQEAMNSGFRRARRYYGA